eukprot:GHVO01030476.1.p2 GENE.GHVO01030476.1~~GHVO01030476.1.p2  ORF type:complete len:151 (+),score=21.38 GHVO01030476.1:579-1031(+)
MNWAEIAEQCGPTAGAASKRYSMMKQPFDAGTDAPTSNAGSPAPKTLSKATPRKKAAVAGGEGTPIPKRKRASPKKKAVSDEMGDEENDDEEIKSKTEQETRTPRSLRRRSSRHRQRKPRSPSPRPPPSPRRTARSQPQEGDHQGRGDRG